MFPVTPIALSCDSVWPRLLQPLARSLVGNEYFTGVPYEFLVRYAQRIIERGCVRVSTSAPVSNLEPFPAESRRNLTSQK